MQRSFLYNFLPSSVIEELNLEGKQDLRQSSFDTLHSLSKLHIGVSMLYADLVGFTSFSAQADPFKVMVFLNDLFQVFDGMCDQYNVHKLETVGDCYVATVGVVTGELVSPGDGNSSRGERSLRSTDATTRNASTLNARDLVGFAKAMIRGSREVMKPEVDTPAIMRIGIHTVSTPVKIPCLTFHFDSHFLSLPCPLNPGLLHKWHHRYQETKI